MSNNLHLHNKNMDDSLYLKKMIKGYLLLAIKALNKEHVFPSKKLVSTFFIHLVLRNIISIPSLFILLPHSVLSSSDILLALDELVKEKLINKNEEKRYKVSHKSHKYDRLIAEWIDVSPEHLERLENEITQVIRKTGVSLRNLEDLNFRKILSILSDANNLLYYSTELHININKTLSIIENPETHFKISCKRLFKTLDNAVAEIICSYLSKLIPYMPNYDSDKHFTISKIKANKKSGVPVLLSGYLVFYNNLMNYNNNDNKNNECVFKLSASLINPSNKKNWIYLVVDKFRGYIFENLKNHNKKRVVILGVTHVFSDTVFIKVDLIVGW